MLQLPVYNFTLAFTRVCPKVFSDKEIINRIRMKFIILLSDACFNQIVYRCLIIIAAKTKIYATTSFYNSDR